VPQAKVECRNIIILGEKNALERNWSGIPKQKIQYGHLLSVIVDVIREIS
jgi:hypothetical protein